MLEQDYLVPKLQAKLRFVCLTFRKDLSDLSNELLVIISCPF